ncbi:hypothetical protein Tco_0585375 [Tanacetum coccineum]
MSNLNINLQTQSSNALHNAIMEAGSEDRPPMLGPGTITLKRFNHYVEGLNHNLFSVGQFCDADLEVAFRKSTCYVYDLKGNDLLTEESQELEGKRKSKPLGLKRLFKIGRSAQVVSSKDKGLGDQEHASKQGRKIDEINQGRYGDNLMFDTGVLDNEQDMAEKETLIEIKGAKPKARGVIVQEPSEFTTTTSLSQPSQLPQAKDKGKAKMVEPEKHLKKKDQIMFDKEAEEQGELTNEEKSKLFVELMNNRKSILQDLEQRRKPLTKAQNRNTMSTYMKNIAGYKHNQLKTKSFEDIQMLFDKEMKRVNTFVDMDTELVKGSETRTEGSSKRAGEELESENLKKQKLDENVEAEVDDDQEEAEMKKHMEIVPDDEVAIDAIPLATKPPIIVDWKIIKEGKMGYFQIIRADGSSKRYSSMIQMLQNIDREDLETLWKLVKAKHGLTRPEEGYERVLWGDLKVMFEPDVESEVSKSTQMRDNTMNTYVLNANLKHKSEAHGV